MRKTTPSSSLLSREEERELIREVRESDKLLELSEEIKTSEGISDVKKIAAKIGIPLRQYKKDIIKGEKARERIFLANQGLIYKLVHKHTKDHKVVFADALQEGNIGLAIALEKFDLSRKVKFSTYAYWWIKSAISQYVSQKTRNVHLPDYLVGQMHVLKKAETAFREKHGRQGTPEELAKWLGWHRSTVERLQPLENEQSLNKAVSEEGGEFQDLLQKEDTKEFWDEAIAAFRREALHQFLNETLGDKERAFRIVKTRFGFYDGGQIISIPKIAQRERLSQKQVKSILTSTLGILRRRRSHLVHLLGEDY